MTLIVIGQYQYLLPEFVWQYVWLADQIVPWIEFESFCDVQFITCGRNLHSQKSVYFEFVLIRL
jgi:hypothetical protein